MGIDLDISLAFFGLAAVWSNEARELYFILGCFTLTISFGGEPDA